MKKINLRKKLSLNKKIISILESEETREIVGGYDDHATDPIFYRHCVTVQTGKNCYSYDNSSTKCQTGCATC